MISESERSIQKIENNIGSSSGNNFLGSFEHEFLNISKGLFEDECTKDIVEAGSNNE